MLPKDNWPLSFHSSTSGSASGVYGPMVVVLNRWAFTHQFMSVVTTSWRGMGQNIWAVTDDFGELVPVNTERGYGLSYQGMPDIAEH